jgi:hypothetical protein
MVLLLLGVSWVLLLSLILSVCVVASEGDRQ